MEGSSSEIRRFPRIFRFALLHKICETASLPSEWALSSRHHLLERVRRFPPAMTSPNSRAHLIWRHHSPHCFGGPPGYGTRLPVSSRAASLSDELPLASSSRFGPCTSQSDPSNSKSAPSTTRSNASPPLEAICQG
jgi:hypothetical protein